MRWKAEWSIYGKLCQEYSYQKLSKSDNWFLNYSQKCRGCFFWDTVYDYFRVTTFVLYKGSNSSGLTYQFAVIAE